LPLHRFAVFSCTHPSHPATYTLSLHDALPISGGERMKAARVFQLTTLALLVVSAVQVGYWVFDQRSYTIEKVHAARAAYAEQAAAAQALLDAGVSAERIQQMLPPTVVERGHASLAP